MSLTRLAIVRSFNICWVGQRGVEPMSDDVCRSCRKPKGRIMEFCAHCGARDPDVLTFVRGELIGGVHPGDHGIALAIRDLINSKPTVPTLTEIVEAIAAARMMQ